MFTPMCVRVCLCVLLERERASDTHTQTELFERHETAETAHSLGMFILSSCLCACRWALCLWGHAQPCTAQWLRKGVWNALCFDITSAHIHSLEFWLHGKELVSDFLSLKFCILQHRLKAVFTFLHSKSVNDWCYSLAMVWRMLEINAYIVLERKYSLLFPSFHIYCTEWYSRHWMHNKRAVSVRTPMENP